MPLQLAHAMGTIALLLAGLVCGGGVRRAHVQRSQINVKPHNVQMASKTTGSALSSSLSSYVLRHLESDGHVGVSNPAKAFLAFLLTFDNPVAGWQIAGCSQNIAGTKLGGNCVRKGGPTALSGDAKASRRLLRKGKEFGMQPVFQELLVGEGSVMAGAMQIACQYASFGPRDAFSGKLAQAQPQEAHEPLLNNLHGAIAIVQRGKASFETKMRHCAAAGALGVILVNSEDERFLAVPDARDPEVPELASAVPEIPFVVVSSSDGTDLAQIGNATIAPLPLENGLPLFPFSKPLLPGASLKVQVGEAERQALKEYLAATAGQIGHVVVAMSDKLTLAQVGTLASVDLERNDTLEEVGVEKPLQITLHGQQRCRMRSLLRASTPDEYGLALVEEIVEEVTAEASDEMDSLFDMLECKPASGVHVDPQALSFALCATIALTPKHGQSALELDIASRLRAMREQFSRNPDRARELLTDAVRQASKQMPP